jgi:hypothetical protein
LRKSKRLTNKRGGVSLRLLKRKLKLWVVHAMAAMSCPKPIQSAEMRGTGFRKWIPATEAAMARKIPVELTTAMTADGTTIGTAAQSRTGPQAAEVYQTPRPGWFLKVRVPKWTVATR